MQQTFDIKDVERRAQRSFYQDGLLEILAGFYFFITGSMIRGGLSAAFTPLFLLLYKPAMEAAKRRFIYPRIGYVKFREEESVNGKAFGRGIIALALFAVASPFISILILGKDPGWEFWTRRFLPFFMGFITAIGPFAAATKYKVKRWYAYVFVCIAAGLGVPFLGMESIYDPIAVEFTIIGGVAFFTGVVIFLAFLIKYPVAAEAEGITDVQG